MIALILGEDNGHGAAGFHAVASVVMNRATSRKWDGTAGEFGDAAETLSVITAPGQFDAVGKDIYNAAMAFPEGGKASGFTAEMFNSAAAVAEGHFTGKMKDSTSGALFFFRDRVPNTSWGQKAIDAGKMVRKYPEGLTDDKKHNNVFWGPK